MTRLRWRAIAACLGIPRWWIRHEARMFRSYDGEEFKAKPYTLDELRNLVVIGQRLPKRHREVRP
jgi:hypothetical protein